MLSIAECLKKSSLLEGISDSPRLDIEVLLAKVLEKDRAYLYTWPEKELSQLQEQQFFAYLKLRQEGQPIAYILGEKEFWSLPLFVNESTLIPRPETELLVQVALDIIEKESQQESHQPKTILDLGTGTGAIALALAHEQAHWHITAVDKMQDAVDLAKLNQEKLSLKNVTFFVSNWFENINNKKFDLIVSNPPYIDPQDNHLFEGDVRFEPSSALVSGNAGYKDIEQIIFQAKDYLVNGGWIVFEHGYQQAETVLALFEKYQFRHAFMTKDLAGNPRVSGAQKDL
jgi:release factor glutamine methyltransferase